MTVPNADRAIIAPEKLTAYLLNVSHKRGGRESEIAPERRISVGRSAAAGVGSADAASVARRDADVGNAYGVVYEIEGPIKTPSGRTVRFCSIWQIDTGTDVPRFITMYPR